MSLSLAEKQTLLHFDLFSFSRVYNVSCDDGKLEGEMRYLHACLLNYMEGIEKFCHSVKSLSSLPPWKLNRMQN